MLINTCPIGIFDSGVGGLTVVKGLLQTMPGENLIYFGDTAHLPYGNKSTEELFSYARNIIKFLLNINAKAILVACGTHSSVTLAHMEKECPVPILGVVKPGSRTAARTTRNGKIGVIATQATVNSHSYARHINTLAPQCQVYEIACPRFVPFIEAGLLSGQDVEDAIDEYIGPLLDKDVDTLVLGCTHYPFLAGPISKYAGSAVKLVDPAAETVDELYDILLKQGIQGSNKTSGSQEFYVSGNDESFYKVGRLLLGDVIKAVAKVDLD